MIELDYTPDGTNRTFTFAIAEGLDPFEVMAMSLRNNPDRPDIAWQRAMERRKNTPPPTGDDQHDARAGVLGANSAETRGRARAGGGVRDTSIIAFDKINRSGKSQSQKQRILDFMLANQHRDFTQRELQKHTGYEINIISARVAALRDDDNAIEEQGKRDCEVTGEYVLAFGVAA